MRKTKIAPCKVCGVAKMDWDLDYKRDATGKFAWVWKCRNCSTTKVCGTRVTKSLPDRPTVADLTASQRRAAANLISYLPDKDAEVTLRGCGRTLFVSIMQFGWLHTTYTIGVRGKVTKL